MHVTSQEDGMIRGLAASPLCSSGQSGRLVEHFSVFDAWRLQTIGAYFRASPAFKCGHDSHGGHQQLVIISGLVRRNPHARDQRYLLAFVLTIIQLIPLCSVLPGSKHGDTAGRD